MSTGPMRLAYIVSRFPVASETFIVRELNELTRLGGFDITLLSLFRNSNRFVHPEAASWLEQPLRPRAGAAASAFATSIVRRPVTWARIVGGVLASTWREPMLMLKSIATLPLAAAHARVVTERDIEHVHAHWATFPALSAWVCAQLCDVTYSFTAHAHDIFTSQAMLERKLRDAAFVVTISEFNRGFLLELGDGVDTSIHVVHCGVTPAAFPFAPRAIPARGEVRALTVATLQEKKGHAVLFAALAREARLARLTLDLVGDGELRAELERRVDELNLGSRVRFHGPQTEDEVRSMLGQADMFVLPSIVARDGQMEGLPVALIEALASGLPVVASRLSAVPELIEEGVSGELAEPGDPESLAAAMVRLIEGEAYDPAAGRALIEREFDIRVSAERLATLLRHAAR